MHKSKNKYSAVFDIFLVINLDFRSRFIRIVRNYHRSEQPISLRMEVNSQFQCTLEFFGIFTWIPSVYIAANLNTKYHFHILLTSQKYRKYQSNLSNYLRIEMPTYIIQYVSMYCMLVQKKFG